MSNSVESVVVRGSHVTAAKVRETVALADAMGLDAFTNSFGYGAMSRCRWHLRVDGKSYPAKAVLGVSADLKHTEHFGGAAHAVNALARLGFHVRNSKTGAFVEPKGLEPHRAATEAHYLGLCEAAGTNVPFPVWPQLPVLPTHYFASGTNEAPQIEGMADSGWDIGVAAQHVRDRAEAALAALAGSDVDVFVDSGAFSEVEFPGGVPTVVKPISSAEWLGRLGLYLRLAKALGSQLYCVAPDLVAHQAETLERLGTYLPQLLQLKALGANVLVPMQKGAMSQVEFAGQVDALLGAGWWLPALPCAKAATSAAEVAEFVAARKPKHVHLLGIGPWSRKAGGARAYLAPFAGTTTTVSMDSAWIPAKVGKAKSRIYTKAQAAAKAVLSAAGWVGTALKRGYSALGLMVCCGHPMPTTTLALACATQPQLPWRSGATAGAVA